MPLLEFLKPEAVLPALRAQGKKQVLQELAAQAARHLPGLDEREIFETLLQRERLGSTGIGEGVAIPHGKLPGLGTLFGLMARLERRSISRPGRQRSTSPSCCSPPRAPAPTT